MNLKKQRILKKFIIGLVVICITTIVSIMICNSVISNSTKDAHFSDLSRVPVNKVGLLLGTSKYMSDGRENLYFKFRIYAASELYKAGKIKYIIASGDNRTVDCNEPLDMKIELIKNGVPDSVIHLDYAGFRTFDSVIRCKEIFGQDNFTIISQEFHNERAIYIAKQFNIKAIGYDAQDVDSYIGFKNKIREKFARVKVFIDLLFNIKPKFLGEKIII